MNSAVLLATWLRENKNIESIRNDEKNKDEHVDISTT